MSRCSSIDDVHVTFASRHGAVRAVDGVSLDVRRGEVVALVGESGCGKTTLLRSVLGLEPITVGIGHVRGPARRLRRAQRCAACAGKVQMVFQDPTGALNPRHTVYEAVAEGIRIHGIAGDERDARRRGARPGRAAPARAVRRAVPARDLRRAAPAGADRRGDRPVAAAAPRRRAGGVARRLDPRRDPRCCCARSSTSRACRSSPSPTTSAWRGTSPTASP